MRIMLSRRAEAELEYKFEDGAARFGTAIAERTFSRVRHMIFQTIPAQPEAATYDEDRDLFECVIPHTPFVVFYRYDARAEEITVLAALRTVARSRLVRGLTVPPTVPPRYNIHCALPFAHRHARSGGPP